MTWRIGIVAVLLAALSVGTGCVGVSRSYAERRYYMLELACPEAAPAPPSAPALVVRSVRISPAFERREFVYRTAESSYEADFYNAFFAPPADLIAERARECLARSGLFSAVLGPSSGIEAQYALEANVAALNGDYRAQAHPKAVLEIQFFLLPVRGPASQLLFEKEYRMSVLLAGKGPDALVKGWDQALQQALEALQKDLHALPLPAVGTCAPKAPQQPNHRSESGVNG